MEVDLCSHATDPDISGGSEDKLIHRNGACDVQICVSDRELQSSLESLELMTLESL